MVELIINSQFYQKLSRYKAWLCKHRSKIMSIAVLLTIVYAYLQPQKFTDIWLTRDQQGQILFKLERYDQAATTFNSTRWQAFSMYGAEQYEQAAILYSQFDTTDDVLARGNAFAQDRRYIKARDVYKAILEKEPDNEAAQVNFTIVQAIIDNVNRMSESQQAEEGDSPQELGDEPQTGDGADKQEARKQEEVEQYSAEELLLNPNLNEMWLRQVQKNPARFLAQKFQMQLLIQEVTALETPKTEDDNDE